MNNKDYQKITFTFEVPVSDVSMSEVKVTMTLKNDYTLKDVVIMFYDFLQCLGFSHITTEEIIRILEENR